MYSQQLILIRLLTISVILKGLLSLSFNVADSFHGAKCTFQTSRNVDGETHDCNNALQWSGSWESKESVGAAMTITFSKVYRVNKIRLYENSDCYTKMVRLEFSDGSRHEVIQEL